MEEGLWFLHQLGPGKALYSLPWTWRARGPLSAVAFQGAVNELVHRHEALRSRFLDVDGRPVQIIEPHSPLSVPVVDLRASADPWLEARRIADAEARTPFDLARGPLLRVHVLRTAEDEHLLVFNVHHIVFDGWSMAVFTHELTALYEAFCTGQPPPVVEPATTYSDAVRRRRERLLDGSLREQLAYWRRQLAGASDVLELPTDRPRPSTPSYAGRTHVFEMSAYLADGVRELARRGRATSFMTLLAAWKLLLYRYTGQEDVVVGVPVAGRAELDLENVIGLFINTVVLRTRMDGALTFQGLLRRVRETVLGAQSHQDVPLDTLVQELRPKRTLGHNPLFQVLFDFSEAAVREWSMGELVLDPVEELETGLVPFDLAMTVQERGSALRGMIDYRTDLFDGPTIERFGSHYRRLLEAVVAHPGMPVSRLPLLPDEELERIVRVWNATERPYPTGRCLHHLLEAQAARTPDATAVVHGRERLTYRRLHEAADALAETLYTLGVGPESRVGLCARRTSRLVIGQLGILKAGGAYLPLDPALPPARLAFIVNDSRPTVVLAERALAGRLSGLTMPVLYLDELDLRTPKTPRKPLREETVRPENLAYVFYTSGSTGVPKGVLIEHRSAVNHIHTVLDRFSREELGGVLAALSMGFDASITEVFAPLARGGTVILADNHLALPDLPASDEVTLLDIVPSVMRELLGNRFPGGVRTVIIGGEPVPADLVRRMYRETGISRVVNAYGPTETSIYSTSKTLPSDLDEKVSIGRPAANQRAYVVDREMEAVPVGVPGELLVGGAGVARGYQRQPGLTAERFLPDPFSGLPGQRLYRTGDLVRLRADGELEFLGRIDQQVKVRGARVELGEVEAALVQHAWVADAVVVATEPIPGDRRLVAYVVGASQGAPSEADLRGHLAARLPSYMVPGTIVKLDAFPLTPNNKVDRRALPDPGQMRGDQGYAAPRTPTQLLVAGIWCEVLGVERVGLHDDFFLLGGHSLTAVRMVSALRNRLGAALSISAVFEAPTLEGFAALLDRAAPRPAEAGPVVAIRSGASRRPLFCVHPVGGNVLCYASLAHHLDAARPVYGLASRSLAGSPPPATIEEMAAQYVASVLEVDPNGPHLLCGWSMGGSIAFEMARQLRERGQRTAALIMLDSVAPTATLLEAEDEAARAGAFVEDLGHSGGCELDLPAAELASLSRSERADRVLAAAKQAGALSADVDAADVARLMAVFDANLLALSRYRPAGVYPGRIVLLRPEVERDEGGPVDPTRGWQPLADAGVELVWAPGDHYTMLREPNVQIVARRIDEVLRTAGAEEG